MTTQEMTREMTQGRAIWKTMAVTRCRTLFCPRGCLLASDNMELGSPL